MKQSNGTVSSRDMRLLSGASPAAIHSPAAATILSLDRRTRDTHRRRKIIPLAGFTNARASRWRWLPLLLAVAILGAACAGVSKPEGWAGPTLADDTLYASVEPGKIAALDTDDLSVKWVFPPDTDEGNRLDLEGVYGAPVVADSVVYFGAYDGNVYALDAEAG